MEGFEQQLQQLWKEGGRSLAVAFLRRAIAADMNLQHLLVALQFEDAARHLDAITLREVLPPTLAPARSAGGRPAAAAPAGAAGSTGIAPAAPASQLRKPAAKARRQRRTPADAARWRQLVCTLLVVEAGSLDSTHLIKTLTARGENIDSARLGVLLRGLVQEGLVKDLGGKPKSWRATSALRAQHA